MVNIDRVGISKKGTVSLQDLLDFVKSNPDLREVGAIATFTGVVKGYSNIGKEVQKLEIEAHKEEAMKSLSLISEKLRERSGIVDVLIHHFTGVFYVGEELVYVVITGKTRKDVFQVLADAVEGYKKSAAIWKKEYLVDGSSYWISE